MPASCWRLVEEKNFAWGRELRTHFGMLLISGSCASHQQAIYRNKILELYTKRHFGIGISHVGTGLCMYRLLRIQKVHFIYLFIYRSRGRKGEREGETHWCERETLIGCLLYALSQGLTHSPGMCPDQEPNRWPLSLWEEVQPNEPHQSGPIQKLYGLWVKSHITSTHPPMVSGGMGWGIPDENLI